MSKFEVGDRVKINVGECKGLSGIVHYIIPPNTTTNGTPEYGYLVRLAPNDKLPWYSESEIERDKERVIFT